MYNESGVVTAYASPLRDLEMDIPPLAALLTSHPLQFKVERFRALLGLFSATVCYPHRER